MPSLDEADDALICEAKRNGFSDRQLATLWGTTEGEVRRDRQRRGIRAVFKLVDTCAAEFEAVTPYYYSTYEREDEARIGDEAAGGDPRRRAQPDRPGDRVRLLLLPGRLRAARPTATRW